MAEALNLGFPCTLTVKVPFPSPHLSNTALRTLSVDAELSPFVRRSFSIPSTDPSVLEVRYVATTHRMLRVAVNGFFESLGVVLGVMEELDVDTLSLDGKEEVWGVGVQGLVKGDGN
ncbi:Pcc1-domain-containing protein [Pseudovirgaria hyperparasitica]|uniref:Pcc1-domain-containing protein n=1 Tax=Pseudovirgaria hyperparasitica TaxID=470096 RepID=A0A6A6W618_9PEZI|nr:Pcc1-domain-containing protein [Pseudovirgaria hyperparasitica]KAF2758368.1 Pcc1-domain-containing protein [Pseudovirgaria hyperparasitica]